MLYEGVGFVADASMNLNDTEPEASFRVHQAYIDAGAQIIETNTFGANRFQTRSPGPWRRSAAAQQPRRESRPRSARSRLPRKY